MRLPSWSTRGPSIGSAALPLIAARAPSWHMLHLVSCQAFSSRPAPIQSRPVPFQLAGGRESWGEAPARRSGPLFPSLFPGAQAVVVHSRQLWLRWMAQGVWSRACHTRRGPPPSLALFCLSGGARAPAHTMEAARMPRGSAGWFPSFAASIKRQTADVPACQRHRWRARRTSRVASTASLGLPNGLSNRICVVIKKGLLSFVGPCFASRSSHTIVWSSISHLVRSSPGFRSRPLPANRRQGLTSGQQAAAVTRLDSVRPVLTPAVHQTV